MTGSACEQCGTENPAQARFCMSCGGALERACPSCGAKPPPNAKFCMECGTPLGGGAPAPAAADGPEADAKEAPRAADQPPEERRQCTVLFADLSGYTAVAETMDPEAVKRLIDSSLRRLGQEVERYGGSIDKYIGDNVMALFGAPVAHEDDEERAVRAALGMQAAMSELNEQLEASHGVSFSLRVGVNTGEVLAGAVGDGYTVIGDAVNVAARLQGAGRPGSVTVGERTQRATHTAIEYEQLEPLELKGKAEPVPAWEARGLTASQPGRRGHTHTQSPLVGREEELTLLTSLAGRVVREGRPHLVTVVAGAGVGKSRVLREFQSRLERDELRVTFREGRCLPYGSGVSYWALAEVIRSECEITEDDSSEVAWGKLSAKVCELLRGLGEDADSAGRKAALIGRLLGMEAAPDAPSADAEDPQRLRESSFSAVRSCVEAMARREPLVLAFEDIHWADSGMLDLIEYLAQWVRAPLLLVCLARDELLERRSGWGESRRGASAIFLEPLTEDETRELLVALLPQSGNGNGSSAALEAMAERAGGNPLFAEEMVHHVGQEGAGADLPDSVQALLAARLDSLEPFERRLMQQAAVVGRTFWQSILEPVAAAEGRDLQQALSALQQKDLVVPESTARLAGETELAFKHVLIRDVAYGMLPKAVRCRKHFEVAGFIEDRAGDRAEELVALLAEHYGRAAALGDESGIDSEELGVMRSKALDFLEGAGDAAASFYSNGEALAHYESARELHVWDDPETLARIGEKQGDVSLRLGRVDSAVKVWEECLDYHRRQESLERVGDLHRKIGAGLWHKGERERAIEHYQKGINLLRDGPPCIELVRLYEEAATLYMHTGDNMLAVYASEKALRLAEQLQETRAASRAHGIFGLVFGRIGDTERALDNLEKSVELARGSDESETIRALLALGSHLEMCDADYDAAGSAYAEGLALAEQVGDLPAQVELHTAIALLAVYRADWDSVRSSGEAGAALAEGEGLVGKLCYPYALRGLLAWHEGDAEASAKHFRRSHELAEQIGLSEVAYNALFGLALTLRDAGDQDGALEALDRALDICERAGLVAQSIQATASRALVLLLAGRDDEAREGAVEAEGLAERLHYPVGRASALEAVGATASDVDAGAEQLDAARVLWQELGRPLEAARCLALRGKLLRESDPAASAEALEQASVELSRHGIGHAMRAAREPAAD